MTHSVRSAVRPYSQTNRGTVVRTIEVENTRRTFWLHVPPTYAKTKSIPLVLVFHGGEGQPQQIERHTGFSDLADREGFIVAYPEGIDKHWNDGRENAPRVNDVAFVTALIEDVARSFNVDRKRIYATGISNGGMFSQRLGCELSGTIAAIASVAATMPDALRARCNPSRPISVLMIHGTDDPLIPYRGGAMARGTMGGNVLSAPDAIRFWVAHNKCAPTPATLELGFDRDPKDGTRVEGESYDHCTANVEVELVTVVGGGHTLPGSRQSLPERLVGRTSTEINGADKIWHFFKRHSAE
jgi:polyhydroxybutyrate depolymerase